MLINQTFVAKNLYELWKYHEIFCNYENVSILYFDFYKEKESLISLFFFINKYYQLHFYVWIVAFLYASLCFRW